ncbi:hypothetical protein D3C80_1300560 [compost metagenome]
MCQLLVEPGSTAFILTRQQGLIALLQGAWSACQRRDPGRVAVDHRHAVLLVHLLARFLPRHGLGIGRRLRRWCGIRLLHLQRRFAGVGILGRVVVVAVETAADQGQRTYQKHQRCQSHGLLPFC